MTTSVTFELATLLDAVLKAAVVAPAKAGNAFDKASGIMLNIYPNTEPNCVIQSTNLDSFYIEAIDVVTASGDDVRWRVPSTLIAEILKNIPQAPGKVVKLEKAPTGGRLGVSCGRAKASLGLIDAEFYPEFDDYEGEYSTTNGVGARVDQVSWACAKAGSEPLTGVHFTGTHVIATDRYRVARTPLIMPISSPITVPAAILANLLKKSGDIHVGATDHQIVFKVDNYSRVHSAIYSMPFPAIEKKVTSIQYSGQMKVNKGELARLVTFVNSASLGDRSPILRLILGKGEIAAFLNGQDAGIGDVIDLPGQLNHPRVNLYFTPAYLLDAITKAPGDLLTISYMIENETKTALKVEDGSGYECWTVPRNPTTNDGGA